MPDRFRILLITHHPLGQGADFIRAWYLGRELSQQGHRVELLCMKAPGIRDQSLWLDHRSLKIIQLGLAGGSFSASLIEGAQATWRCCRWLVSGQAFDIVHTFGPRPIVLLPALLGRIFQDAKWIVDWSDWWGFGGIASQRSTLGKMTVGLSDHIFERWSLQRADGITVVNGWAEKRVIDIGNKAKAVLNLGVGASVADIHPMNKAEARARLDIPGSARVVGYTGLSAFDQPLLGAVLQKLIAKSPEIHLLLIGRSPRYWHNQPALASAGARVKIIDHVPHYLLSPYLAAAELFLLPFSDQGLHEARMPLRLGDYMAAGRPVVTSARSEVAELVEREGIGLAVEPRAAAFAEGVLQLLADDQKISEMGNRARSLAIEKFSWNQASLRLLNFYKEVSTD